MTQYDGKAAGTNAFAAGWNTITSDKNASPNVAFITYGKLDDGTYNVVSATGTNAASLALEKNKTTSSAGNITSGTALLQIQSDGTYKVSTGVSNMPNVTISAGAYKAVSGAVVMIVTSNIGATTTDDAVFVIGPVSPAKTTVFGDDVATTYDVLLNGVRTTIESSVALTRGQLYNRLTKADDGYYNGGAGTGGAYEWEKVNSANAKGSTGGASASSETDVGAGVASNRTLTSTSANTIYKYRMTGSTTYAVYETGALLFIQKGNLTTKDMDSAVVSDNFKAYSYNAKGNGVGSDDEFTQIDINLDSGRAAGLMGTNNDTVYVAMNANGTVDYIVVVNANTTYSLSWSSSAIVIDEKSSTSGTYTTANVTPLADIMAWTAAATPTFGVWADGSNTSDHFTVSMAGTRDDSAKTALSEAAAADATFDATGGSDQVTGAATVSSGSTYNIYDVKLTLTVGASDVTV